MNNGSGQHWQRQIRMHQAYRMTSRSLEHCAVVIGRKVLYCVCRYQSTIKPYPNGRGFAYIKRDDGGEDVFVLVRDLPVDGNQPGCQSVESTLVESYDKKKSGIQSERSAFAASTTEPTTRPHSVSCCGCVG